MYEKGVKKNECASSCFLLLYTVRSHFYRVSHFFQESCAKNIEENEKKMKNKHRRCGSIMDARALIYIYIYIEKERHHRRDPDTASVDREGRCQTLQNI